MLASRLPASSAMVGEGRGRGGDKGDSSGSVRLVTKFCVAPRRVMPKVTITVRQHAASATLPHVTVRRFTIPRERAAEAERAPRSRSRGEDGGRDPRRSHDPASRDIPANKHTVPSECWDQAHAAGALSVVMRRPRAARNCVEEQAATG